MVLKQLPSYLIFLLGILLLAFTKQLKAQSQNSIQASVISANTGSENSFLDSFGMAFEYQRKLENSHFFGSFSFISAINQTNNPNSGAVALDGYLKSYFGFNTGVEYLLLNKKQNNMGFGIGPALRLRREVEPVLSVERQVLGQQEVLVQNRYRSKLDFGIVAFLDYTHILPSNIQLGLRAKYGTYGDQNGVFSAELGVGYNFN